MAKTNLTLRLDIKLTERAKKIARRRGISVSRMVADYFGELETVERQTENLPPLTDPFTVSSKDPSSANGRTPNTSRRSTREDPVDTSVT